MWNSFLTWPGPDTYMYVPVRHAREGASSDPNNNKMHFPGLIVLLKSGPATQPHSHSQLNSIQKL